MKMELNLSQDDYRKEEFLSGAIVKCPCCKQNIEIDQDILYNEIPSKSLQNNF